MSRTAMEQTVSLLGSLSTSELEQLSAKVAALRVLSGPAASSSPGVAAGLAVDSSFEALLFLALSEALSAEGIEPAAYPVFLGTRAGRAFSSAAAAAGRVHAQWFPQASRAQTAALCRIYARSTLNFLEAKDMPLCWSALSSALKDLSGVLDHAFPGYARCGAMSMLLRNTAEA